MNRSSFLKTFMGGIAGLAVAPYLASEVVAESPVICLNADLLDGQHGFFYLDNPSQWSIGDIIDCEDFEGRFYTCPFTNREIETVRECCAFGEDGSPLFWLKDRYVDTGEVHTFTERIRPYLKVAFPDVNFDEI